MKTSATITIVISIIWIVNCANVTEYNQQVCNLFDRRSHLWILGEKQPEDQLLWKDVVSMKAKWFQFVEMDLEYPRRIEQLENQIINYIVAYDQYQNGFGGYVTLVDGGFGDRFVILHVRSQWGHGFNFRIEIYGNKTA